MFIKVNRYGGSAGYFPISLAVESILWLEERVGENRCDAHLRNGQDVALCESREMVEELVAKCSQ